MIRKFWLSAGLILPLWWTSLYGAQDGALPLRGLTADEIVARMVERADHEAQRTNGALHSWRRVTVVEEFDGQGRVEQRKTKEHRVVGREGAQQTTLIRFNDRPPTNRELDREQKREAENRNRYAQRSERRDRFEIDTQLIRRFRYQWLSNDIVEGRGAYVLGFTPQPDQDRSKVADRILGGLGGRIWVDAEVFEVSRIEAELLHEISIGGFIAEVNSLGFDIDRRPLPEGVWVSVRLKSYAAGRKLFDRFSGRMEVRQEDFQPWTPALLNSPATGIEAARP